MKANRLALVGILLGLAGTVLLALFVTSSSGEKAGETAAVWMASDAGIAAGTPAEEVAAAAVLRDVPLDLVPARALIGPDDVVGQQVSRPLGPGEILTADQFAPVGPAAGGLVVPEGWEVLSVEASPAPGVEGYATTGSLLNLYYTATTKPQATADGQTVAGEAFTQLVTAHTEVLAVTRGTLTGEATAVNEQAAAGGMVFLLKVRPEDVPTLVFAEQNGSLWFSLANADDPAPTSERFTFEDLDPAAITQSISEARTQLEADRAATEAAEADELARRNTSADVPTSTDGGE